MPMTRDDHLAALLASPDKVPFVGNDLMEHLKAVFPNGVPAYDPRSPMSGDRLLVEVGVIGGHQQVIQYLERIQSAQVTGESVEVPHHQGMNVNEPSETQGAGTDPRRPGTRSRS